MRHNLNALIPDQHRESTPMGAVWNRAGWRGTVHERDVPHKVVGIEGFSFALNDAVLLEIDDLALG